jgi:hypothetical protein
LNATRASIAGIVGGIAGVAMAMIPLVHPMIPEQMPPPGAFMANMGTVGVALLLVEHLMYGAIVGGLYGPVQHSREAHAVRA